MIYKYIKLDFKKLLLKNQKKCTLELESEDYFRPMPVRKPPTSI